MKTKILFYFFILLVVAACKPEIDEFAPEKGNADFTKYVGIGNSLTAGYADGDLSRTSQQYSLGNLLGQQFKLVGGGEFVQPLMVDDNAFGKRLVLGMATDCKGVTSLAPIPAGAANPANMVNIYATEGPFNNFGVPGTKSFMATVNGYGNLNPYFGRFMSSPTTSLLADAMAAAPTFFTIWLGSNDILWYAVTGGENGGDSITPEAIFNASITGVVAGMKSSGGKGAIANIPDIEYIPFFITVPAKGLVLDATNAAALNAAYAAYNAGAQQMGLPQITFTVGANYWIVKDPAIPAPLGGLRQMKAGELIRLDIPQDSMKCFGWGTQVPIPARFILDLSEINKIHGATVAYNAIIQGIAQENDLALVDMNSHFKELKSGLVFDGMKFTTTFVTGGVFSLDGIHPNPRGNAIIANYWIEAINAKFGSRIPLLNIGDYPGVLFP
ncbi:MAG: SGNH/GDSL hydrolase family protein [Bacteroidales bacterium]